MSNECSCHKMASWEKPLWSIMTINLLVMIFSGLACFCIIWNFALFRDTVFDPSMKFAFYAHGTTLFAVAIAISWMYSKTFLNTLKDWRNRSRGCESTKKAVIATLSSPYDWKSKGEKLEHASGLVLVLSRPGKIYTMGLFSCDFTEKQSHEIEKAIDVMYSAKLTHTMACDPDGTKMYPMVSNT